MNLQPVSLSGDDFLKILNGIGQKEGMVVKIVDIFDFNGSWINGLHRFVGKKDILLIGNKVRYITEINQSESTDQLDEGGSG